MDQNSKNKNFSFTGLIVTIIVTLGFVWAGMQWRERDNWPKPLTLEQIQLNETHTFENIRLIADAQKKYIQTDWDRDGKKVYAKFLPHLWTSVDTKSEQIPVNLIGKDLAFAVGTSRPVDGFYFIDLRKRESSQRDRAKDFDYQNQWAVAGVPAVRKETGRLVFLVDDSNRIFIKKSRRTPMSYPFDPPAEGWTEIKIVQQLKTFQETLGYTPKKHSR